MPTSKMYHWSGHKTWRHWHDNRMAFRYRLHRGDIDSVFAKWFSPVFTTCTIINVANFQKSASNHNQTFLLCMSSNLSIVKIIKFICNISKTASFNFFPAFFMTLSTTSNFAKSSNKKNILHYYDSKFEKIRTQCNVIFCNPEFNWIPSNE